MMELTKLTKVRFFGTILLENIPQLCFSLLYMNYTGYPSNNTILSLTMSILQILSAIINYIVMRIPTDCYPIQYDLEMKIALNSELKMLYRMQSQGKFDSNDEEKQSYDDFDVEDDTDFVDETATF